MGQAQVAAEPDLNGNSFSLWRDGKLEGAIVHLEGNVETAGAKLAAPATLLPLTSDFLHWNPIPPKNAKQLAQVSARLCRLLRDEVVEQMARGSPGLTGLHKTGENFSFPKRMTHNLRTAMRKR